VAKNGNSLEIQFPDKQTLENWVSSLKSVCIMVNFHDEYKATKMIGKGSFAKVNNVIFTIVNEFKGLSC